MALHQTRKRASSESEVSAAETNSKGSGSEKGVAESVFSDAHSAPVPGRATPSEASTASTDVSLTFTERVNLALQRLPPAPANSPATRSVVTGIFGIQRPVNPTIVRYLSESLQRELNGTDENNVEIPHFHEHSMWAEFAMETCHEGLKRLATLAGDLNKVDDSISIEAYYSKHLGDAIKAAGVKVDVEILKKAMGGDEH